jgi:hypothetical protein
MTRPKTEALPGMERKGIKEIETLADDYVSHRDKRMAALKKELEAKTKLIDAMKKHGQKTYEFEEDGLTVTVELQIGDESVKVKKAELGEGD